MHDVSSIYEDLNVDILNAFDGEEGVLDAELIVVDRKGE
jgi:hypothetical protein